MFHVRYARYIRYGRYTTLISRTAATPVARYIRYARYTHLDLADGSHPGRVVDALVDNVEQRSGGLPHAAEL